MVNGGCHLLISFASLKQSTCPFVDNLGIFAAQCSNQMQLAQGHNLNANFALVLPAFGCFIPLL